MFSFSCKKEVERPAPEFEVSVEKNVYQVGEEAVFNFTGDPDLISFYSGEILSDYNFRDGRIVEPGILRLSFQSNVQFGTQADQLSVLASTAFNGNYSFSDGIKPEEWINISDRFRFGTNATFVNSGEADISDLVEEGQPLYIAFRYNVRNQATAGVGRTWRVQNLSFTSETSIGLIQMGTNQTAGFQLIDKLPETAPMRSSISATTISLVAHAVTDANRTIETENWAISKAFYGGTQDLGPDRPVALKGITDAPMQQHTYIYTQPGSYTAYFVATNVNIYGSNEVVKRVDFEVIE